MIPIVLDTKSAWYSVIVGENEPWASFLPFLTQLPSFSVILVSFFSARFLCVSFYHLTFFPGIAPSTNFKPNVASTWAKLRFLVSTKIQNNADFQTGDIWHFADPSKILSVLSDGTMHFVKIVITYFILIL